MTQKKPLRPDSLRDEVAEDAIPKAPARSEASSDEFKFRFGIQQALIAMKWPPMVARAVKIRPSAG